MGCGIVNRFILRHYYDLFDDSMQYDGIYICKKCGYKKQWMLEMCETLTCPKCGGNMPIRIGHKDTVKKVLCGQIVLSDLAR